MKAEVWGRLGVTSLHWDKDVEGEKAKKTLPVAGISGHHSQDEAESVLCLFTITLCREFNSLYVMNEGTEAQRGREAGQGHTAAWSQDSNPSPLHKAFLSWDEGPPWP